MQFYFIRHGQSENNRLYALTQSWAGRSEDPSLTPLGQQQAELLAEFLQGAGRVKASSSKRDPQNAGGFGLTHLYCSLMVRAVETGIVVARALRMPLTAWVDAHEIGGIHRKNEEGGEPQGQPGKSRAFFETRFPDLILPSTLGKQGWWSRPFENQEERPKRAQRFLTDLLDRHGDSDHRVAVISHGGFYNHLMRVILGLPGDQGFEFSLNNAAITRVDWDDGCDRGIWIHYMNRADFLPAEMIT